MWFSHHHLHNTQSSYCWSECSWYLWSFHLHEFLSNEEREIISSPHQKRICTFLVIIVWLQYIHSILLLSISVCLNRHCWWLLLYCFIALFDVGNLFNSTLFLAFSQFVWFWTSEWRLGHRRKDQQVVCTDKSQLMTLVTPFFSIQTGFSK